MIKRAELRTGNLFHNNLGAISILFVREIREDAIIGKELDGVFNGSFDEEDISGVPLTEEWMGRMGFMKAERMMQLFFSIEGFSITTYSENKVDYYWLAYYYNSGNIHIKYVHQLQNLVYALTGKELTLTPAKEETP